MSSGNAESTLCAIRQNKGMCRGEEWITAVTTACGLYRKVAEGKTFHVTRVSWKVGNDTKKYKFVKLTADVQYFYKIHNRSSASRQHFAP